MVIQRDKDLLNIRKEKVNFDIILQWPKLVEYTNLSEYESKIYLCLLYLGGASARKISQYCDVPRTKIYDTINKLIESGFVLEVPGVPKRFLPTPPQDAFEAFLNISKKKALDFNILVDFLIENYKLSINENKLFEKKVWFTDDNDEIRKRINELMKKTKRDFTIFTNSDGLELIFHLSNKFLDDLQERGIEVKLYSPLEPKSNPLARELSYMFEVKKVCWDCPILFIESDKTKFFIIKIVKQNHEVKFDYAVFSDDTHLLSLIHILLFNQAQNKNIKTSILEGQ